MTSERRPTADSLMDQSTVSVRSTPALESPRTSNGSNNKSSERSAVVLALYGPSVGPCVGDFSTTYNRANGRLYAATKAILFYSNLFGFERRLCLKISEIEGIEAYRSTSIKISMVDCEDHVFRKFINRDAVLSILNDLYHKELASIAHRSTPPTPRSSMAIESFPMPIRHINQTEEGQKQEDESFSRDLDCEELRNRLVSDVSEPKVLQTDLASLRPRSRSVPSLNGDLVRSPEDTRQQQRQSGTPTAKARRFRRAVSSMSMRSSPLVMPRVQSSVPTNLDKVTVTAPKAYESNVVPQNFDIMKGWEATRTPYTDEALSVRIFLLFDEPKPSFRTNFGLRQATLIPCSLDTFMNKFLSDDAVYPISKYQREKIKDRNISYSDWKKKDSSEYPPIFSRDINFIHPLDNTVGPSEAKTTREQQYQRFGSHGICVQNTTRIQGVPGADCFRVEDRWIIERVSESSVKLAVSFQLVFHKRTIFKPIIQKNSKAETKKWFAGFSRYLVSISRDETDKSGTSLPLSVPVSENDAEPLSVNEGVSGTKISVPWTAVLCIAFAFAIMSLQLVHLQRSVYLMQEQLSAIQARDEELQRMLKAVLAGERFR